MSRAGAPWESGGRSVSRACWRGLDQGVPHPGTGVARVADQLPVEPVVVVDRGCGCGERHERGFEEGAVLGGSAALDPDPAGSVGCDREVSAQVGGTFLAVQLPLELPVHRVGVDHLHQMAAGAGEVGGIEAPGMLEQGGFSPGSDRRT